MANTPIIEAEALTKRFPDHPRPKKSRKHGAPAPADTTVHAVTDLNMIVQRGELVAFLGPNGAGKSTSLKMLTTLLRPTSGTARVVGFDIARESSKVRARIGYVGQLTSGSFAQRVRDELRSQGAFYGLGAAASRARADELIESLDLARFATRQVQQLSGGQKRRLDIALGLMHAPPLLFLDEPSTGLDPQSRANLWQHIVDLRARYGTTVFLTTHYLDEADRYAERVMVMDQGRVIADDTAGTLKAQLAGDAVSLGFASEADAERALTVVRRLTDRNVVRSGTSVDVTAPDGARLLPAAIVALHGEGLRVLDARGVPPTLDDVFLALTGRSLREAGAGGAGDDDDHDTAPDASQGAHDTAAGDPAAHDKTGAVR